MMTEQPQPTADQIVGQYIAYRDHVAALREKHSAELAPYTQAMEQIENYLQAFMQQNGVDSLKTAHGTPYRATGTSIKTTDAEAFKDFVLEPAADSIYRALHTAGVQLPPEYKNHFLMLLKTEALWALTDFRAGKKGVEEYVENQRGELPPGIEINQFEKVNIRRA